MPTGGISLMETITGAMLIPDPPTFTRTIFNDSAGFRQEETPPSVAQLNSEGSLTNMTFDKVRKFNAYDSMLKTHSIHHSRTSKIHHQHEQKLQQATSAGEHHQPEVKPQFPGDPGPWDGTYHGNSIGARKARVAKGQADMQGDYTPLSDFCHRIEDSQKDVDSANPFNVVFHTDNCLTLQLRAAKDMAGLMSDKPTPEDPHFAALMKKRERLGRSEWVRALPDTSSKWSNQVERMKIALNQEDFNEDGRLEGGPCEYTYRELKLLKKGDKKFKTFFRVPGAGFCGKNINGTTPTLLVKTEMELTQAAEARRWARARLVDEEARVYAKKRIALLKSSSSKKLSHSGRMSIRTSTPFNGSRPVSRMHTVNVSRPNTRQQRL